MLFQPDTLAIRYHISYNPCHFHHHSPQPTIKVYRKTLPKVRLSQLLPFVDQTAEPIMKAEM